MGLFSALFGPSDDFLDNAFTDSSAGKDDSISEIYERRELQNKAHRAYEQLSDTQKQAYHDRRAAKEEETEEQKRKRIQEEDEERERFYGGN